MARGRGSARVRVTNALPPALSMPHAQILVFPGVQILDFTGPHDVLATAGYDVTTVAPTLDAVECNGGLRVQPDRSIADAFEGDCLVVPGGYGVRQAADDDALLRWIDDASGRATDVLSVCTGAFFFAKLGSLDGGEATTYHTSIQRLREAAPAATIVEDRRVVEHGKMVIAAGVSAGIDGAFRILEKRRSRAFAMQTALWLEYDWQPEGDYCRAALADRHITRALASLELEGDASMETVETHGDRDAWTLGWACRGEVRGPLTACLDASWERTGEGSWSWTSEGSVWNAALEARDDHLALFIQRRPSRRAGDGGEGDGRSPAPASTRP